MPPLNFVGVFCACLVIGQFRAPAFSSCVVPWDPIALFFLCLRSPFHGQQALRGQPAVLGARQ
jgi:hypothetical protein